MHSKNKIDIIKKITDEVEKSGKIEKFYMAKTINYIGRTYDTREDYSEIIAGELLKLDFKNKILSIKEIVREKGYKVDAHSGVVATASSEDQANRKIEWIAINLFNQSKNGKVFNNLGTIVDYQIPLKDKLTDKIGKIDLISVNKNDIFLIELKIKESTETLLRCILEISTYYQVLGKAKFIESYPKEFSNLAEKNIKKVVLIAKESSQYDE
ncbi:MAG TPA: hypothetical protein VIK72_09245, partial [Clostridiaceae bacterium]